MHRATRERAEQRYDGGRVGKLPARPARSLRWSDVEGHPEILEGAERVFVGLVVADIDRRDVSRPRGPISRPQDVEHGESLVPPDRGARLDRELAFLGCSPAARIRSRASRAIRSRAPGSTARRCIVSVTPFSSTHAPGASISRSARATAAVRRSKCETSGCSNAPRPGASICRPWFPATPTGAPLMRLRRSSRARPLTTVTWVSLRSAQAINAAQRLPGHGGFPRMIDQRRQRAVEVQEQGDLAPADEGLDAGPEVLGGHRPVRLGYAVERCGEEILEPVIEIVAAIALLEPCHPRSALRLRHGQRAVQRLHDAVDVVRVDQQRVGFLHGLRNSCEPGEDEDPWLIDLTGHELLCDQVHAVAERCDQRYVCVAVHCGEPGRGHRSVQVLHGRPVAGSELSVHAADQLVDLALEDLVFRHFRAAGDGELDQADLAAVAACVAWSSLSKAWIRSGIPLV